MRRTTGLLTAVLISGICVSAHADIIIHESATMGTPGVGGGWTLSEDYFLGSRFHVHVTLEVTKIGGHMLHWQSASHPGDLFGAIEWVEEKKPADEQLQRFRAEAARLLDIEQESESESEPETPTSDERPAP